MAVVGFEAAVMSSNFAFPAVRDEEARDQTDTSNHGVGAENAGGVCKFSATGALVVRANETSPGRILPDDCLEL